MSWDKSGAWDSDKLSASSISVDGISIADGSIIVGNSSDVGSVLASGSFLTFKEIDFLPVGWALTGDSPPADTSVLCAGTVNSVEIRDLDPVSDEDLLFPWQVPYYLTGSTIDFRVQCLVSNVTGPSDEGWVFFLQGASYGSGDNLSGALGTAISAAATQVTAGQYAFVYTDWSAPVTVSNLLSGETAVLRLYRDVSDALDDYGQDIGVFGLDVRYNRVLSYT